MTQHKNTSKMSELIYLLFGWFDLVLVRIKSMTDLKKTDFGSNMSTMKLKKSTHKHTLVIYLSANRI